MPPPRLIFVLLDLCLRDWRSPERQKKIPNRFYTHTEVDSEATIKYLQALQDNISAQVEIIEAKYNKISSYAEITHTLKPKSISSLWFGNK